MFLKPKIKLHAITDITPDMLEKYGITALILDVDNTLSTHHGQKLTDGLENWLDIMNKAYYPFKLKGKKGKALCRENRA